MGGIRGREAMWKKRAEEGQCKVSQEWQQLYRRKGLSWLDAIRFDRQFIGRALKEVAEGRDAGAGGAE